MTANKFKSVLIVFQSIILHASEIKHRITLILSRKEDCLVLSEAFTEEKK